MSVFNKDDKLPVKSTHFRGEKGISWVVARLAPIDARINAPPPPVRVGQPAQFSGEQLAGKIVSWQWDSGLGKTGKGRQLSHTFAKPDDHEVKLTFSDGKYTERIIAKITVDPPVGAHITPLKAPVMVGKPIEVAGDTSFGKVKTHAWDFGDGGTAVGSKARHAFVKQGIYKVTLTVCDGKFSGKLSVNACRRPLQRSILSRTRDGRRLETSPTRGGASICTSTTRSPNTHGGV